jgi:hypothetical protein
MDHKTVHAQTAQPSVRSQAQAKAAPATAAKAAPQTKPAAVQHSLQLPSLVVSPTDIARLLRELEALDDYLHQAALRKTGQPMQLPRMSRVLEQFSTNNTLNLLTSAERKQAKDFLTLVHTKAPVLHISFASDPSAAFVNKLVLWLRENINPYTLVRLGLEPAIAAGCIVRTPNRQLDFSLRKHFAGQKSNLLARLQGVAPNTEAPAP